MFAESILSRIARTRVVAGFSVERAVDAVPLANALLEGGIDVIELTLRTDAAMEGLRAICDQVPEILVGVGTILTPQAVADVRDAGAHFGVSPGLNPSVVIAAQKLGLPFAPGISTPSDLEGAIELGCHFVKFFPAEASGGINYLRSMSAPYKHLGIQYFPLGGVNADNMLEYLAEPNVTAVGGSWIVKQNLVDAGDWQAITARAAEVVKVAEVVGAVKEQFENEGTQG